MGKSLSMLARISKTLEHSQKWAIEGHDNLREAHKKFCRATLVIVPSGCKTSFLPRLCLLISA
jgi:hypothetical protein